MGMYNVTTRAAVEDEVANKADKAASQHLL
jgi:hypothetical protein